MKYTAEDLIKAKKRKAEIKIKPLAEKFQERLGWAGAYGLKTGEIELGSTEKDAIRILFHELMHKELFEKESLEAGTMWDKISRNVERHIFGKRTDPPFIYTQPAKRAKPTERSKAWEESGKGIKKSELRTAVQTTISLGITTYRTAKKENINIAAYNETKKGNYEKAAIIIAKTIKNKLLNALSLHIISNNPTVGVYEGGKEPSCFPILKGELTNETIGKIKDFKIKAHQDSILLSVWGKGTPAIKINKLHEYDLTNFREKLFKATSGKIGGYLTYDFQTETVYIMNVKEFDTLSPQEFSNLIPTIRQTAREFKANISTFKTENIII